MVAISSWARPNWRSSKSNKISWWPQMCLEYVLIAKFGELLSTHRDDQKLETIMLLMNKLGTLDGKSKKDSAKNRVGGRAFIVVRRDIWDTLSMMFEEWRTITKLTITGAEGIVPCFDIFMSHGESVKYNRTLQTRNQISMMLFPMVRFFAMRSGGQSWNESIWEQGLRAWVVSGASALSSTRGEHGRRNHIELFSNTSGCVNASKFWASRVK